jgi:two-component system LytT family response regulator
MSSGEGRPRRRHAVIVDDERLARRELRTLLEEGHAATVHVVGDAASVADAARLVAATDADLVFLDITLGAESGFDLLPHLGEDVDVVFVTAHDAYAIRAFEVNALDYLLKPVEPERLARAVARSVARTAPPPSAGGDAARPLTPDDRLFLRLDGRRAFVRVGDVVALRAAGDESLLHLAGRAAPARTPRSLREWEARLPERSFVRVHRSTIINLAHVLRVEEWSHASYLVYLRGLPEPVAMSRRYGMRVRDQLG